MKSVAPNSCGSPDQGFVDISDKNVIPLDMLANREEATIVRIDAGQNAFTRLCHLGLTPGAMVMKITGAPFQGPIEIRVRDTLLAIGRGLARKVLVVRKVEGRASKP